MHGKTIVYKNNKELYTIEKYYREQLFPSKDGKIIAIVKPYISRYIIIQDEPEKYEDEVITIFKNGKPYLNYKLNQLIEISQLEEKKLGDSFNWTFKHDRFDSWFNRFRYKKVEKHNTFIHNNILHLITCVNTIIRINLGNGERLSNLNLEHSLPIKKYFKPLKRKVKINKIKYPEDFTLPKLDNGNFLRYELSKYLKMELANNSFNEEHNLSVYIHTLIINKGGECELAFVNSGNESLDNKIVSWLKIIRFNNNEIPEKFDKFKFKGFVDLKK